jgi:hypothetical protein
LDLPVPSGEVTIFWTWINSIGNREYYMECADIVVNTNAANAANAMPISGKELLVANYPGYPQIPEFPRADMYDGSDLLANRKDITIFSPGRRATITGQTTTRPIQQTTSTNVIRPTNSRQIQPTNLIIPPTSPTSNPRPKLSRKELTRNCTTGRMVCINENEFNVCSNLEWYKFHCAEGTECVQHDDFYIMCNVCV